METLKERFRRIYEVTVREGKDCIRVVKKARPDLGRTTSMANIFISGTK